MSGNAGVSDKTEPDRPCLEGSDVQVRRSYVSALRLRVSASESSWMLTHNRDQD